MSSLPKTLWRWYSPVRGLMNSRAPISGFDRPSRASRAIWVSWAVSPLLVSTVTLRAVSPVAMSSREARSANPAAPMAASMSCAVRNSSRASSRRRCRRSHSPYARWARASHARARVRVSRAIASRYRPARGGACGSPNPPASSAGVNPRGSSSSASGLPRVSATIRSRTRSSSGPQITEPSSARISIAQALDDQLGQACQLALVASYARCQDQRDGLRHQTARNEAERLRRGPIQPLRVVDHAEQRLVSGHLGQQAQGGETDKEAIRRIPCSQPERRGERITLGARQALEPIQHRRAQLLQAGERQLHLGLDSDGPHDSHPRCRVDRVLQQGGLTDPRLASHHQSPALTPTDRLEVPVERLTLTAPAE